MLKSFLSSPQTVVLEKALSAASLRHKVISNNIANVNTPGFKKSQVVFEDYLQQAMDGRKQSLAVTHDRHIGLKNRSIPNPETEMSSSTTFRLDGNNVDIDVEMAELAKNSLYYDAVVQQISRYYINLKSAINEGRR